MSMDLIHRFYAGTAPWLALSLLFLGRRPSLSGIRISGSLLLAFLLLRVPVFGWPLFAWIRTLESNPSFSLTGLLAIALWQRITGRVIFSRQDWTAAWIAGTIASLLLYPMGLGLTRMDSYTWGWEPLLPMGTAFTATILLLRGNRFGILLLLTQAGFLQHLQESANYWDALVDPWYGGFSLIAATVLLIRRMKPSALH